MIIFNSQNVEILQFEILYQIVDSLVTVQILV